MLKRLTIILLSLTLLLAACGEAGGEKILEEVDYQGSLIRTTGQDFIHGVKENTTLNDKEEIVLEEGELSGTYVSPTLLTDEFRELIATWNVDTPENTSIEFSVQVRIEDEWTMWYSYGEWSSNMDGGSSFDQSDKYGKLSIDHLEILWGKEADAAKYKIELKRKSESAESPSIKRIYLTLKTLEPTATALAEDLNYLVELDVPERSQMIIPQIGNVICSPTSLAMVLEYYGVNMTTEDVSACAYDNSVGIYGNWTFNASYAGSQGLDSRVEIFESMDQVREKIAEGIPVVVSINTKSEDILVGAPQAYPAGHLLVIRGFTEKDGEEYVIVNDPASPEEANVRREYTVSGMERAWRNVVYIISQEAQEE